jgi:hypothetical protein
MNMDTLGKLETGDLVGVEFKLAAANRAHMLETDSGGPCVEQSLALWTTAINLRLFLS